MTVSEEPIGLSQVMDVNRYSTLNKMLRITAYVCRFINNLKKTLANQEIKFGKVEVEEIEKAEVRWVKEVQKALEGQPGYQKYKEQLGVVERNGILVCEGRLEFANLESRTKRPVLLPKDHKCTELVILDCHNKVHHCTVNATLAELRSRYWVVKGRQFVKKVIRKCFICKKLEGKPYSFPMIAPLPDFMVNEAPPFSRVGVDFAGPLYCKGTRGSPIKVTFCYSPAVSQELFILSSPMI